MLNLISKAQNGDPEAFIQLMEENKLTLYKTAKAILKNDEDAADAIQETILSCYKNIRTLKQHSYFRTWLTKILINKCNDIIHQNRFTYYTDFADSENYAADESDNDTRLSVNNCLMSLPQREQLIMVLYYINGYRIKEISNILGINENTVKTHLYRGRERFKTNFTEERSIQHG